MGIAQYHNDESLPIIVSQQCVLRMTEYAEITAIMHIRNMG